MKIAEPDIDFNNCTDEELVQLFVSGGSEVFETLFKRYYRRVYGLCLRFCSLDSNLAEEAAQETFLQIYKSLGSFQFKSSFYTWLYRVTFNTCSVAIKKASRHRAGSIDALMEVLEASPSSSPSDVLAKREHQSQMVGVLKELPDDQKKIMVLGPIMGYSYQEISEIIGETITVVKGRLFRARQNFKKKFEKCENNSNLPLTEHTKSDETHGEDGDSH